MQKLMRIKSRVDELIQQEQKAKEAEKEYYDNLKLSCKELFAGQNGLFFLKFLKKISLWNEQDNNINNEILIYKKGRRDTWAIIRNLIPKDVLAQVEIYDEEKS